MHPFQRLLNILGWVALGIFFVSFTVFLFSNDKWMLEHIVPLMYGTWGGFGFASFRAICFFLFPPKELMKELFPGY